MRRIVIYGIVLSIVLTGLIFSAPYLRFSHQVQSSFQIGSPMYALWTQGNQTYLNITDVYSSPINVQYGAFSSCIYPEHTITLPFNSSTTEFTVTFPERTVVEVVQVS